MLTRSSSSSALREWMNATQLLTEVACERLLPAATHAPQHLHQAMRYAVLGGGKRVRALLAFAAGKLTQAPQSRLEVVAAALESIHAYSLIHDDLPCMDNDVLRRGKPTCHIAFDEATALLAGDALQSLAFELIATPELARDAQTQLKMSETLALAVGSRGMAGGQAADLANSGKALDSVELEFMHIRKTGALIRASVLLGAQCGGALEPSQLEALEHYSKCIGLLFQVVDDILDAESDTATLGKTAGKDARQNKATYASVIGVPAARDLGDELYAEAFSALQAFGDSAQRLRDLATYIARRSF